MAMNTAAQPMAPTKRRPAGVTVLGILTLLVGILSFLAGIIVIALGFVQFLSQINIGFSNPLLSGIAYLALGVLLFLCGAGLLRLAMWALGLGIILWILAIVLNVIPLAYGIHLSLFNYVAIGFSVLIIIYLIAVRNHFR